MEPELMNVGEFIVDWKDNDPQPTEETSFDILPEIQEFDTKKELRRINLTDDSDRVLARSSEVDRTALLHKKELNVDYNVDVWKTQRRISGYHEDQ
jgi:hypothetical protein